MTPKSEQELAEMIKASAGPLKIQGGGTRDIGAPIDGQILDVSGLNGVSLYEPGAMTLVAGAGTALEDIQTLLAGEGQRLAFDPPDLRGLLGTKGQSTIGGVIATNASGSRRIQVGAARDFTLGVRFVDGQGQILKNGGRVMKNVTGYDLVKLMAGSWGTLGVLSDVSLKVMAIPEAHATLACHGQTPTEAVAAMSAALGSPYDVSGAAHMNGTTYIRVEGLAPSVAYRSAELQSKTLTGFEVTSDAAIWDDIRDVTRFGGRDGAVWRVSVKPSDAPALVAAMEPHLHEAILDWGGGLVWLRLNDEDRMSADAVRAEVAKCGGHATLVRGSQSLRQEIDVFQPEIPVLAKITRDLREKFDPRGILNPGLMGA